MSETLEVVKPIQSDMIDIFVFIVYLIYDGRYLLLDKKLWGTKCINFYLNKQ